MVVNIRDGDTGCSGTGAKYYVNDLSLRSYFWVSENISPDGLPVLVSSHFGHI